MQVDYCHDSNPNLTMDGCIQHVQHSIRYESVTGQASISQHRRRVYNNSLGIKGWPRCSIFNFHIEPPTNIPKLLFLIQIPKLLFLRTHRDVFVCKIWNICLSPWIPCHGLKSRVLDSFQWLEIWRLLWKVIISNTIVHSYQL